ncbi:MAG: hypothetical protein QG666_544, partial [Euryarchaeota archaeon]|nr:hypothetical protein [Euryarchaeota archaeon]
MALIVLPFEKNILGL